MVIINGKSGAKTKGKKKVIIEKFRNTWGRPIAKSHDGNIIMATCKKTIHISEVLEILAKSHICSPLILFQVLLPLGLIGLGILYLHVFEKINNGFAYVVGRGVFLIFSGLFLLGVSRTIKQVRHFVKEMKQTIVLSLMWDNVLLVASILIFVYYGMNISSVPFIPVSNISNEEVVGKLYIWSRHGIVVLLISVFLGWAAVRRTIRALLNSSIILKKNDNRNND